MAILSKVQKGQPITAELFNNMIDAIRECQVTSVVGSGGTISTFKRGPGGTTISITSQKNQGGGAQATICPFDATITPVTSGFDISFSAGKVNEILPTNMFSPFESVSTGSLNYFYVKCESDGKLITSAVIEKDTEIRTPQASNADTAPDELNILIGYLATSGMFVKTIPCENITARIYPTVQEDNVTYVAGARNFKQYYSWGT